ncbi:D-alanyl-D-alanine endopeptidase [Pseudomaricurvus alcaniphilus]|uniref:D-alanyl-D-alanine endopeptidase n=1 Tax=Pseudomaricurvus alcaniphilus TaxID=1166482 RepID=UPI001409872D|nr:D-alanyl-D-alanine endopeptidase [Pseudomaricurvus alcaniphilus]NHN39860.1 D-alanyl-D-alanine endopeptidase [Pseudomaricurvus alcaniphilus]
MSGYFQLGVRTIWLLLACLPAGLHASTPAAVNLASVSAVVVDLERDETLLSQHDDIQLPVASITKLMTAMVVLDSAAELNEWLEIRDWTGDLEKNAFSRIRVTSQARRRDLLRLALMSSENRAAFNLALHHPGGLPAFVAAMNAKAKALGMENSHFADPTGLSIENRATAADLAVMLVAAYGYPLLREYSTTRQFTINFRKPRYRLGYGNTNPLVSSSRWQVSLTKTGYLTESGRCLVMVTEMDDRTVGLVLLNSFGKRSPLGDAGRIRRWLETGNAGTVARAAQEHRQQVLDKAGKL